MVDRPVSTAAVRRVKFNINHVIHILNRMLRAGSGVNFATRGVIFGCVGRAQMYYPGSRFYLTDLSWKYILLKINNHKYSQHNQMGVYLLHVSACAGHSQI